MTDYRNPTLAKPRILITGGSGLLALNWFAAARDRYDVVLAFHERTPTIPGATGCKLDLDSTDQLLAALDAHAPEFVVHAAGCTSVEGCEKAPDVAHHVNVVLAANVASACKARGIPFVHISTDHLFAGNAAMATEETPVAPLNSYGKTKAEAELRVAEACPDALVIRTNFYGWGTSYRRSFSDVIVDALRQKRSITLFDDVHYTPILAECLVEIVHGLLACKAQGVFNVVGSERLTKYRFGLLVAEAFGLDAAPIQLGALADQPELVSRPRDMSLSNQKVSALLGRDPGTVSEHLHRLRLQEQRGLALELGKL
ncbi:MAG: SDR family oxidoreductase [Denitromonas halophila]|nr:MAG: SDR family oxidoreductase [Denitromonas halophila]